jgi:hypothetical protein
MFPSQILYTSLVRLAYTTHSTCRNATRLHIQTARDPPTGRDKYISLETLEIRTRLGIKWVLITKSYDCFVGTAEDARFVRRDLSSALTALLHCTQQSTAAHKIHLHGAHVSGILTSPHAT